MLVIALLKGEHKVRPYHPAERMIKANMEHGKMMAGYVFLFEGYIRIIFF
ncbi:MAG: hypothetical protein HQK66_13400 [Desulfamplus sp.]|nr:hypothetical protein [Desulfamplus sp.]